MASWLDARAFLTLDDIHVEAQRVNSQTYRLWPIDSSFACGIWSFYTLLMVRRRDRAFAIMYSRYPFAGIGKIDGHTLAFGQSYRRAAY